MKEAQKKAHAVDALRVLAFAVAEGRALNVPVLTMLAGLECLDMRAQRGHLLEISKALGAAADAVAAG